MIIIGVDPSLTMTGVAAYDSETRKFLDADAWPAEGEDMAHRLDCIVQKVAGFKSDCAGNGTVIIGIEENHFYPGRSVQTAMAQREVIGAVSALAGACDWLGVRVAPTEVKKALTGSGVASKDDMVAAAREHLDLTGFKKNQIKDIADAMGVCLAVREKIISG